jgi:hypothetical protein
VDFEDESNDYYCYCTDWKAVMESVWDEVEIGTGNTNLI